MKLLIVDGSKVERARLVDAFGQVTNVAVIGAVARLGTALHAIGQSSPDVVVTDVRYGDDEGVSALLDALRRSSTPPRVVVFASEDGPAVRQRCLDGGADRFVAKHAGLPALLRAVIEVAASRTRAQTNGEGTAFVARVAGGIAHDLNNQLTVVDATLSLLQKHLTTGKVPNELLLARRALDSAAALSQALSRHAHRGKHPTLRLDLGILARRTLDVFGRSLPMNVQTELSIEDGRPLAIIASERDVERAIMNLVLDAAEELPDGGTIAVRVHVPANDTVQVAVGPDRVDFPAA